jgi:hypothetical protein
VTGEGLRSRPISVLALVAGLIVLAVAGLIALDIVRAPWADTGGGPADGRLRIEFAVMPADDLGPDANDVTVVADIVRRRLESIGLTNGSVDVSGPARIAVVVPSADDGPVVRRVALPRGRLDFVPLGQEQVQEDQVLDLRTHPSLFGGDQVDAASVGSDQQGFATVDFTLRPEAARLFGQYTAVHIGDYFAITLDGRVLAAPVIQSAIAGGDIQIELGGQDQTSTRDAQELVAILQYGSFPWLLIEIAPGPIPTPLGTVSGSREILTATTSQEPRRPRQKS